MKKIYKKTEQKKISSSMYPTNDYIFKRLFGYKGKENITKDFVETVIHCKIDSISIDNSTILEKDYYFIGASFTQKAYLKENIMEH